MNIKEASEQIEGAIHAYLAKDERDLYLIPFKMQRPIIMLGPPGVGKTAIVEQIAERMGINFVSYSITHHTRQSALGLPFITKEEFDGQTYSVSEYTMSEIIAAVHRARKKNGVKEGILFLDEANCVSETLAPAMLQFLQCKTFGLHQLPEGWVIVTAGNPPEYNRAAREFDPAMLDRLMKIDVEPDLGAWLEYALAHGVHPAITTYLDAKPSDFYKVRAGAHSFQVVTSRGWEDLSRMLIAYEHLGQTPPSAIHERYLQDEAIASSFSVYYELFKKYQDGYRVSEILRGKGDSVVDRARKAPFDERLALVGMLIDAVLDRIRAATELNEALTDVDVDLKRIRHELDQSDSPLDFLGNCIEEVRAETHISKKKRIGDWRAVRGERLRVLLAAQRKLFENQTGRKKPSAIARSAITGEKKRLDERISSARQSIDNSFIFLDGTFGEDSQEAQLFITRLSSDIAAVRFVLDFGSEEYMKHNKNLLFDEREFNLLAEIKMLEGLK